jgi:hypothetical protein
MTRSTSIKPFFAGLLMKHLPNRTKRLILFASLSARMCNTTRFDKSTLSKLNQVMLLGSDDNALTLPVQLSKVIWKGDAGVQVHYPEPQAVDPEEAISRVFEAIPQWLRYAQPETIRADLMTFMSHRDLIAAHPAV